ncbi:TolC family protein [Endothiovibrio diazotrophicus]
MRALPLPLFLKRFASLLLWLAPALAAAAEPPPLALSLTEAVVLAIRQNRDVANAYRDRVVEKFALAVAEDTFTPTGRLTGSASRTAGDGTRSDRLTVTPTLNWKVPTGAELTLSWAESLNRDDAGNDSSAVRTVTVTQPLLQGAGTTVATAPVVQARNEERINVESLRSTLAGTVDSVVQAYRSLLQAQAELEIGRRSLERSRKLVEINRILIDNGRMARQELVQAEADVAAREVSLASAENAVDRARLTLLGLLALDRYTAVDPVEPLDVPEVSLDYDRLSERALERRPDYRQALLNLENRRLDRLLADDGRRPQLDLTGRYADTRGAGSGDDWTVGLNLEVPFFDRSQDLSPLRARIAVEKAETSLVDLRERIGREVLNGVRDVNIRRRQVDLARRSLALSEKKLEIERAKLQAGRSSNFQVVQFENDLVSAQNGELSAVISYLNALTSLDATLGTTLDTWKIELEPAQ